MDASLIFVGVLVSLVVQGIKMYFGTNTTATLLSVAALSLLAAFGAVELQSLGYWTSFLQILTVAGAFYGFIIKNSADAIASYRTNV